jgi:hypothetical protein
MNKIVGWTDTYCICGYPVTGLISKEFTKVEGVSLRLPVCSLDTDCPERMSAEYEPEFPRQRPAFVRAIRDARANGDDPLELRVGI